MTTPPTPPNNLPTAKLVLRAYFALAALTGALTIGSLLRIPTEAQNTALLGLSKERLVMVAVVGMLSLAALAMLLASWLRKIWFQAFQQNLTKKISRKNTWGLLILVCSLGLLAGSYYVLLTPEISEPFTRAYLDRLQPLILWLAQLCGLTLVALSLLRFGTGFSALKPQTRITYQIAAIFGLLLIGWIWIAQTGIGVIRPEGGSWNTLGAPVMETQAFLAWLVALIYIGLALWGENHPEFLERLHQIKLLRSDLVLSLLIWLVAFIIWNSLPLIPNWFATFSGPPNAAIYPSSDAISYDSTAQSLLAGLGFKTYNAPFARRPLYAFFLAGIHALGGLDYEPVVWMQVAALALIPVLIFGITRQIHNRASALIAAALLIARESNAIILGNSITTSHSKLLMADLPTTLGVMLFTLLMIRWLQKPGQRQTLTLIAGGVTGAFMLIRPEFGVLLPFIGLAALGQLFRTPKVWFKGMLLIAAGTLLMLAPWVWRNYQITGTIFLDSPYYRADLFANRYQESEASAPEPVIPTSTPEASAPQPTPTRKVAIQEGESAEEFAERMTEEAAQFAKDNPLAVLGFIRDHFVHSQVQTLLYLPATFRLGDSALSLLGHRDPAKFQESCCSAQNYIRRLPFWFKWDGTLPRQSSIPLLVNLFLVSVGLASAWKQQRFISLVPLAAGFGYTLINAAVRNSGGRYILPVDWIGMLYFAMGLGQLTLWVIAYFRGANLPPGLTGEIRPQPPEDSPSLWQAANLWVALGILLLGCLLPLSEKIISPPFSAELLENRRTALHEIMPVDWDAFTQSGGKVLQGRALYPSFYEADDEAVLGNPFNLPPFGQVYFFIIGPFNGSVILPREAAPGIFPHGADVLLMGCQQEKYFDALVVLVYDDAGDQIAVLQRQPFPEITTCPLPMP